MGKLQQPTSDIDVEPPTVFVAYLAKHCIRIYFWLNTHAVFSQICCKNRWRFYVDVRGGLPQLAHLAVRGILTCADW